MAALQGRGRPAYWEAASSPQCGRCVMAAGDQAMRWRNQCGDALLSDMFLAARVRVVLHR